MKIPQLVIDKLQLIESSEQVGNSFGHNLLIFESSHPDLKGAKFMECDMIGNPYDYVTIYYQGNVTAATLEFLTDMDMNLIIKMIQKLCE